MEIESIYIFEFVLTLFVGLIVYMGKSALSRLSEVEKDVEKIKTNLAINSKEDQIRWEMIHSSIKGIEAGQQLIMTKLESYGKALVELKVKEEARARNEVTK